MQLIASLQTGKISRSQKKHNKHTMKILLIGGTGLVGSYLLPMLVERGDEVYALTRNPDKIEKINIIFFGVISNCKKNYKKSNS